ncbi:unknown protein [Paenibacillus amylolyticus]|uniref:Uncharacterized protein n=1 Tax=Paenibacillus amylolyticus TaxID=1451 RepID=A0A100VM91_PAEAM|nr:hypothetical protein [Paenibacillus sp. LS1]MCW3790668.1 hypothetical protein [Paenibacillus sp. LS1]GAS82465.1 unknown protein [Paenibacillus amylolyticus]
MPDTVKSSTIFSMNIPRRSGMNAMIGEEGLEVLSQRSNLPASLIRGVLL